MLRVKEICKEQGITLTDLAARMGISQPGLSQALNRNLTYEVLTRIAKALNVSIAELFEKQQIELLIKYDGKIYQIPESKIIELIKNGEAILIEHT